MIARPRLIAHAEVESYSVLTRLPPPHRASPDIVQAFITERFTEPFLILSETGYEELLATIAAGQILGGPAYDALIAFTAAEHNATLMSLDQRAAATYEAVGAQVEQKRHEYGTQQGECSAKRGWAFGAWLTCGACRVMG
jgi:hypothetical protein